MSLFSSAFVGVPTTPATIPVKIFHQVISNLSQRDSLKLRLVCREINFRTLHGFDPHTSCFHRLNGKFTRKRLDHILKIAHYPSAQRLVRNVTIRIMIDGKLLWRPKSQEWKRDSMGYIAHPEQVYGICIVKEIMKKLPDCKSFRLTYDINKKKKKEQWQGSLKFTVEAILAICAVTELNIMGIELCDHASSFCAQAIASITVKHGSPFRPWDKSKPMLDAACALM